MASKEYKLVDHGHLKKLEQFGPYLIVRPAAQAIYAPALPEKEWSKAHASFSREGQNNWTGIETLPKTWPIQMGPITFKLSPTDFGHLGIFPEQSPFWQWIFETIKTNSASRPLKVLNLFAYSGGSTLAAAAAGAEVCHLDASKGMVDWARENAALSGLQKAPIRWIVDDVKKFLLREERRQSTYDAIILDPPSFGRGSKGQVFKLEDDLMPLLHQCRKLLSPNPLFILLSCHTPGITPKILEHALSQATDGLHGHLTSGEMLLDCVSSRPLSAGSYAKWCH